MGGVTGAILLGALASPGIDKVAASGHQVLVQCLGVGSVALYSFVVTYVVIVVINALGSIRVSAMEESVGLDASLHGETAYSL